MDLNKQKPYKWPPSTLSSEMAAAADSKMDITRHMNVPDKILVSESHTSTPTTAHQYGYGSSASSTPLSSVQPTPTSARPVPSYLSAEGGMSVPRRIMMGGETPSQPMHRPHFADYTPSALAEVPAANSGRQTSAPGWADDRDRYGRDILEDSSRVGSHGAKLTHTSAASGPMGQEIEDLKRRVATLERQLARRGGGGAMSGDGAPRGGGGILTMMVLCFWLFNPFMFHLWRQSR